MDNGVKETELHRLAHYHLPGLFEFYEFYMVFLPLFFEHREFFYEWCDIGSIYGAPADCLWGGGRVENDENNTLEALKLVKEYNISARLTFSNSLLKVEHLSDERCNRLCGLLQQNNSVENGIIIYSDLLLRYIRERFPNLYFVSSTTKVITDFAQLIDELDRTEFRYVVPDFRMNNKLEQLDGLLDEQKEKVELLCNEACFFGCKDRKLCYESVSHKILGDDGPDFACSAPDARDGYVFSKAMDNPGFVGIDNIKNVYLPMGISNYKIEGRGLGSALLLEFLLYYMTKPEYQLRVREKLYLNHSLDLF